MGLVGNAVRQKNLHVIIPGLLCHSHTSCQPSLSMHVIAVDVLWHVGARELQPDKVPGGI